MSTVLISSGVFVAVVLVTTLLYWIWSNVFSSRGKAKKERLQAIHATIHARDHRLDSALSYRTENELETWLRSRSRTFARLESLVNRSRSPITAGHLTGIMLALFIVALVFGFLRQFNIWLLFAQAIAIAIAPLLWLSRQAGKRGQAFGKKLPDALNYISRALRASHSLNMAISMVGREFPDPIGTEFKTVADKISFGIPFKDAISQLSESIQSKDINFFVVSILIQHETGGNLTELLDGLANTMRERIKLRGKIRTLSSEGRASAWILGSLPFVLAVILWIANPDYISLLWKTEQGQNLMVIGFILLFAGLVALNRLVKIKV